MNQNILVQLYGFVEALDSDELTTLDALISQGKTPAKFASYPSELKAARSFFGKVAALTLAP